MSDGAAENQGIEFDYPATIISYQAKSVHYSLGKNMRLYAMSSRVSNSNEHQYTTTMFIDVSPSIIILKLFRVGK